MRVDLDIDSVEFEGQRCIAAIGLRNNVKIRVPCQSQSSRSQSSRSNVRFKGAGTVISNKTRDMKKIDCCLCIT